MGQGPSGGAAGSIQKASALGRHERPMEALPGTGKVGVRPRDPALLTVTRGAELLGGDGGSRLVSWRADSGGQLGQAGLGARSSCFL